MHPSAPGPRTLVHVVRAAAAAQPGKAWIASEDRSATYDGIDRLSNRIARGLAGLGLARGDRLATMLTDSIEQIAVWLACCKLGLREVPVNTAYRGDILAHVVRDSGARAAVVSAGLAERFADLGAPPPVLQRIILLPDGDDAVPPAGIACTMFRSLLSEDDSAIGDPPAEQDIMAIMYTSGTTGRSKGVMVTHVHACEYARAVVTALGLDATDIFHTSGLPLFHVAGRWGVVLAAALVGGTVALPARFSVRSYWNDVRRAGATATFLLGTMASFLHAQDPDPSDPDNPMRKVLMCPLLRDVAGFAERFGVQVGTAYGSTEANAPVVMPLGTPVADNQVVGRVRAETFDLIVADGNDRPVSPGTVGEILVRPREPWLTMQGYWNHTEATNRAWRNLWLHTGDAGRMDEAGNVYFVDRLQDTIRRRGENISSMEVEAVIVQHPAIAECAVFP
ncbi:MAG: AMP-binding protein, partial [Proteobacteria bacterium]|nr:AMP-binding protein [Pseudomonadota bacterium]